MKCPEVRRLFDEYLEKTLGERQRALLEDHAGSCPDCRRELEKVLHYREMMSGLSRVDAPDGFLAGVRRRVAEENIPEKQGILRRAREFLFFPLKIKLPIEATAVAAAVLAIVVAIRVTGPARQGGKTTDRLVGTQAEMKKSEPVLEESPASARKKDGIVKEFAGTGPKKEGPKGTAREERIEVMLLLKTRAPVSDTGAEAQKQAEAPASVDELVGRIAGFIGQEGGKVLEIIEPGNEGKIGAPVTLLAEAQAINLQRILQGLGTFGELEIPDQPDLLTIKETTSILLRITIPQ
jgi:hypothetical protein